MTRLKEWFGQWEWAAVFVYGGIVVLWVVLVVALMVGLR